MTNGKLTTEQIERLVKPIDPSHVETKRGNLSYMAQHEVRAELTRVFGFGNWDTQVESMQLIYETELTKGMAQYPKSGTGQPYYVACYRASVRLTIRDFEGNWLCSFLEWHAEENAPLPNRGEAHAMAMTSVESYAMRRAAIGLGDRFGLGLYNKGALTPLVRGTLQLPQKTSKPSEPAGAPEVPVEVSTPAEPEEAQTPQPDQDEPENQPTEATAPVEEGWLAWKRAIDNANSLIQLTQIRNQLAKNRLLETAIPGDPGNRVVEDYLIHRRGEVEKAKPGAARLQQGINHDA